MLTIGSQGVVIKSLLLESQQGHANITGNISGGCFEGVVEITPASEKDLGNMYITYKTSQGNYKFPFKASLNN